MCAQVLEDRRDDGAVGVTAVWVRCVGGDRPKRDAQPNEAAEHRSAPRALVDVLREARPLAGGERTVQRIRHRSLREAVISMHAIPSGHVRSDP
jgi:hypothetical protein